MPEVTVLPMSNAWCNEIPCEARATFTRERAILLNPDVNNRGGLNEVPAYNHLTMLNCSVMRDLLPLSQGARATCTGPPPARRRARPTPRPPQQSQSVSWAHSRPPAGGGGDARTPPPPPPWKFPFFFNRLQG